MTSRTSANLGSKCWRRTPWILEVDGYVWYQTIGYGCEHDSRREDSEGEALRSNEQRCQHIATESAVIHARLISRLYYITSQRDFTARPSREEDEVCHPRPDINSCLANKPMERSMRCRCSRHAHAYISIAIVGQVIAKDLMIEDKLRPAVGHATVERSFPSPSTEGPNSLKSHEPASLLYSRSSSALNVAGDSSLKRLRVRTNDLTNPLAVLEKEESRHGPDPELLRDVWNLVYIKLVESCGWVVV